MARHDDRPLPDDNVDGPLHVAQQAQIDAEHSTMRLQLLDALTDVILHYPSLNELVKNLTEHVQVIMRVDNVAILRYNEARQGLIMATVRGPEEIVADRVFVPVGQGVAGKIFSSQKPMIIDDISKVDVVNSFLHEHLHSLLGVPLRVEDRVIGVLHISTVLARQFVQEDVQMLQLVADRIAVAIDRAEIFEATKQARAAAEERAIQLEAMNRRMDTFLSIASHEMRTPLTTIIANLDLLQRRMARVEHDPSPAALNAAITAVIPLAQRARTQAGRINRLIGDLLDVSRIQADQLEIRRTPSDLRDIVRDAVAEQRILMPTRDIRLQLPADAILMEIDADRIGQVVTNYLTNALKFTTTQSFIQVRIENRPTEAYVGVSDQGPGITADDQEHIWDRYHRVESIQHQQGSYIGLGLGLYICKTIIARHHGQIGVSSVIDQGSTFWFTLPQPDTATLQP